MSLTLSLCFWLMRLLHWPLAEWNSRKRRRQLKTPFFCFGPSYISPLLKGSSFFPPLLSIAALYYAVGLFVCETENRANAACRKLEVGVRGWLLKFGSFLPFRLSLLAEENQSWSSRHLRIHPFTALFGQWVSWDMPSRVLIYCFAPLFVLDWCDHPITVES